MAKDKAEASGLSGVSVGALYGVGPARCRAFAKLGVHTIEDLLYHYPRAYEYRGDIRLLSETSPEGKSAVILTVSTAPRAAMIRRGMTLLRFRAYDESCSAGGSCEITYFNQNYLKDTFTVGATYRFYGKVERRGSGYMMASPAFEEVTPGQEDELPALIPVYPATEGLSQKQIASAVSLALRMAASEGEDDMLPAQTRQARALCAQSFALRSIHRPRDMESLALAKRRLVYDEFYLFALGLAATRARVREGVAPVCDRADLSVLEAQLPFSLTGAQRRAIEDIRREMASSVPMSRMVVGDVGCGKTICAAAAMLFAVQSGRQAALMAPTEILARQHARELSDLFSRLGISCELLIGATTAAKKRDIRARLADGTLSVVIGTQALLSDGVEFAAPALVVTDEQHRFGVNQRATLSQKNRHAHLLVMSATPIPRSLALGLYGDLDISRIDEMPPGRQVVDTFVVDEGYRARLNGFIRKQVAEDGQVYVVCPAIDEQRADADDELDEDVLLGDVSLRGAFDMDLSALQRAAHDDKPPLKTALGMAEQLAHDLGDIAVECLHGKMKAAQKDEIMARFVSGEVKVLVSTTVIEVGVNVPSATLMIVENAERFGLAQLHQLRGRVGRGKRKSYCVLVAGSRPGETARRRLETMRTQHDGFEIARQDLLLRGPGDFLRGSSDGESGAGIRQSGGIQFRLADGCDDADLMETAFADARSLLEQDATLSGYPVLRARMERMFTVDASILN